MIYSPYFEEIRNQLFDIRYQLHLWEGRVIGTGITHGVVSGIGSDYHLLVYLKDESAISLIPTSVYGIPVAYMITGEVRAFPCSPSGNTCNCTGITGQFKDKHRPLRAGSSVGQGRIYNFPGYSWYCYTGTLGGFPKLSDGTTVILSNNHVIALDNPQFRIGKVGDPIIQPGTLDNGDIAIDKIGALKNWITIPNKSSGNAKFDGGIASIDSGIGVDLNGLCNYPTNYTVAPAIGMKIKKAGRTTGCTTGTIQALDVSLDVNFCSSGTCLAHFVGQIQTSANMSNAGDSGSVVVTDDSNNNAVGLLFAGSGNGTSFLNVMADLEPALGFSFGTPPQCVQPACNFIASL